MAYIDKINKNSTDYDLQDSKAARSVDGTTASHVELTNEIYTESTQVGTGSFIYRTTAGDLSIETGDAAIQYIDGNTVQTGHVDEVKDMQTQFVSSGATATIDWGTFDARVTTLSPSYTTGTTTFVYQEANTQWSYTSTYGASGTIGRTNLASQWGITLSGVSSEGDTITVDYTKLVIGTLATATPASFVATGFNQYDATAGYAHVVGNNQYRIDGTYTGLGFTTTAGGTTTPVTVTNNRFTPTEDGYIYVTGGSGDILIALVWSGTMDSEPYSAYSTSTITIPTADASSTALPTASYGMPSVHGVSDRLSFVDKTYIQRIGHYAYSAENLATVEAMGVDYWYDTNDIFYVLASPVTYTLADSVSGEYAVNDYGTEEFIGTTVPVNASITYGNSLVDKLRNLLTIQSVGSGLTLTGTELSVGGGGGGVTTLTTSDYNWPTSSPDGINPIALSTGVYKITRGMDLYFRGSNNTGHVKETVGADMYLLVDNDIATGSQAPLLSTTPADGIRAVVGNNAGTTMTDSKYYAALSDIFADPATQQKIRIGDSASTNGLGGVALGIGSQASGVYSVAIGAYSSGTSTQGVVSFGGSNLEGAGYNNSRYRLLTNVYDGQSAHDAATVGQITPTTDSSAPTTSTAGRLGEIRIDTTDDSAYMCVNTTGGTYSWKKITA